ncbi:hypothetical protein RM572_00675 [Streptomyces sp. DSM 42041]|uniref:Uncharacterized protein n=1 Tax=Streptomyces hazeniae TaxID=3075538 RepID=A0ABU2NKJ6_9ACTN|nr:hypothetical protein [Streptomyces sp. DSM 42041]MDT0377290.1 hypothetical protein [Streptomyces sp. DSM 42041]
MHRPCTAAAALLASLTLALTGCATDTTEPAAGADNAKPATKKAEPAPPPEPTPELPVYDTEEQKLNELAAEKGWEFDYTLYETAADYVNDMCASLPAWGDEAAETLAEAQNPTEDEAAALRAGIPDFCPDWEDTVIKALEGDFPRTFHDGTYTVNTSGKEGTVAPGTYTVTDVQECYWERTAPNGDIIDNQFATAAQAITVTIASTDGSFTARGCGGWKSQG